MSVPPSPTALMLPGQAAAPEGPADLTMMYVLHHAFRRDLDDFVGAVQRLPIDDRAAWQRLAARWGVFGELLHDHHHKEDDHLWPLLVDRASAAGDEDALRTLAEMAAEHASIDPLLAAVAHGFARLTRHADDEARTALVGALVDARRHLGDHLAHEETDAIAILQRYVPGQEWAALEAEKFRRGLTLAQVKVLVPWAYKGLSPAATDHLNRTAGPPFRLVRRLQARKFARGERAAFGRRTPTRQDPS